MDRAPILDIPARRLYYVYLLESLQNHALYIGYTDDLRERVKKHNEGKNASTRRYLPWKVVYYEAYNSQKDALAREKALKGRGQAIKELKLRLRNGLHP